VIKNRIAVQTRCLGQPFKKALLTAARLECDGVQFDARQELRPSDLSATGARQVRKMLDDLDLRVASIAFPTEYGFANASRLEQSMDGAVEAMRMAASLQGEILLLNLGSLPETADLSEWRVLTDALGSLSSRSLHFGIQLAAYVPGADPSHLAAWIDSMPEGTLGVDLSPAAIIAHGRSPAEFVAALGPHIIHVHGNDAVRDLTSNQGLEVELGRGSADFPALVGQLQEFHYRGWITITRHSSQVVEEIGNAVTYLRAL
jgi:sugar phosphate isomerase/epimerase